MTELLQGRRLPDARWNEDGTGWDAWRGAQPGDYMKVLDPPKVLRSDGGPGWYIKDPAGVVGSLRTHSVVEHEDGTVTVSPSIFDAPDGWHGWLERGVWRRA